MTLTGLIWIVIIAAVFVGGLWWALRDDKGINLDVNKDGKVDLKDASAAVDKAVAEVEKAVVEVKKRATKKAPAKKAPAAKKPRAPRKPKNG